MEECVAVFAQCLSSAQFNTVIWSPSYSKWLMKRDMMECVEYHKVVVEHFSSVVDKRNNSKTWVFKTPQHLHTIAAILKVYPDARFVYTHRDPLQVFSSLASIVTHMFGMGSDELDLKAIGRDALDFWSALQQRSLEERKKVKPDRIYDVFFSDLNQDPIQAVSKIYQHFGMDFTQAIASKLEQYSQNNKKGKHGHHRHNLHDFYQEGEVEARFKQYRKQYFNL